MEAAGKKPRILSTLKYAQYKLPKCYHKYYQRPVKTWHELQPVIGQVGLIPYRGKLSPTVPSCPGWFSGPPSFPSNGYCV
jgi:hypothetical protein